MHYPEKVVKPQIFNYLYSFDVGFQYASNMLLGYLFHFLFEEHNPTVKLFLKSIDFNAFLCLRYFK